MNLSLDRGYYEQWLKIRYSTILLPISLCTLIYYIPYRNEVHIGKLFGLSLWFYFGLLNAILLILVYVTIRGQIVLDFNEEKFIIREPKSNKEWSFSDLYGIYLLAYDRQYLIRLRPKKLLTYDLKVDFETAYKLVDMFEEKGFKLKHIRYDSPSRVNVPFPILLSKWDQKPSDFNPEFPNWKRGPTLRAKLISITIAPMLYIVAATLVIRIPYLLRGLTLTRWIVSSIYWLTAALLVDSGLYLLFGLSIVAYITTRIIRIFLHSSSSAK
ncbi:MAG: hypothetical protein ACTSPI_01975 [Candidatus Heimdallarchaeaceae archaeon]